MNRILVTGATGGLGRNAVEFLANRGVPIRAGGRAPAVLAQLAAYGPQLAGDLATMPNDELRAGVADCAAVWHCAALSSPWGSAAAFHAANVSASERLFTAAAEAGVPVFVQVSTPALYFDYRHRYRVREDQLARHYANHYARSKALAEERLRALARRHPGTRLTILRPRALFGPHDRVLLPRLLRLHDARDGRLPLPNGGRTILDLTYVGNVVHALWLATQTAPPSGAAYNISNDAPLPLAAALTTLLRDELGLPLRIRSLPYPLLAGAAWACEAYGRLGGGEPPLTRYGVGVLAYDMTIDLAAARRDLAYRPPVPLAQAFAETARWLKSRHG